VTLEEELRLHADVYGFFLARLWAGYLIDKEGIDPHQCLNGMKDEWARTLQLSHGEESEEAVRTKAAERTVFYDQFVYRIRREVDKHLAGQGEDPS
jgi:hypothetical protein